MASNVYDIYLHLEEVIRDSSGQIKHVWLELHPAGSRVDHLEVREDVPISGCRTEIHSRFLETVWGRENAFMEARCLARGIIDYRSWRNGIVAIKVPYISLTIDEIAAILLRKAAWREIE